MGRTALRLALLCITLGLAGCDSAGVAPVGSAGTSAEQPRFEVVAEGLLRALRRATGR